MEPEVSLPHSQVAATCSYPEPARSSPCSPHPISLRSILILSSHLRLGLPSGLFGEKLKTHYTPILRFSRELGSETRRETRKSENNQPPPKNNVLVTFGVFFTETF